MKHFYKEYKDSKMNIEMWSFEERKQWLAFTENTVNLFYIHTFI